MPWTDLSLDALRIFRPERTEPADFDAFWATTLAETRAHPLELKIEPVETGLTVIETFDVTFSGFGGHPIKAWLLLPRARRGRLPCVVEYHGYGGGRGLPHSWLLWAAAGYAHLVMDTRGQGGRNLPGATPDPVGADSSAPGWLTRGIRDPQSYYYRRVYADAVRAIEAARAHPEIDPQRVAVAGISQGGGISLAAAALVPDISAVVAEVPFLCAFRLSSQKAPRGPYLELTDYLRAHHPIVEQVFQVLGYFDGVNMAARARATARFTVTLMDDVCPPSSVFAAFNHYAGEKTIDVYEYMAHEATAGRVVAERLAFMKSKLPT